MDGDRKYRQHGYLDTDRGSSGSFRDERARAQSPKLPLDITGPKLPRLVQSVVALRCFSCATTLPQGISFQDKCPKCGVALHCCKQCAHFEPSTRFQCLKPVPVRIPSKDQSNECSMFSPRVTVARDAMPMQQPAIVRGDAGRASLAPRSQSDARAAFDSLFKK
jgi:hypothetical protein